MFLNNPEFVRVDNKKYKINTDYRVALKCDEIARDKSISDYERSLAIIYLLYGDEGLEDKENYEQLINLAIKYLSCGQEIEDTNEKPDMDFEQDMSLIKASFKSDYGIILNDEKMHWWDFYMYLNGLTEKCILNRVRELRTYDTSKIKDTKERNKIEKSKRRFALRETPEKITEEQQKNVDIFYQLTGLNRKE